MNTSDELMEVDISEQFIADCTRQAQKDEEQRRTSEGRNPG